jgi:hypothetical protein
MTSRARSLGQALRDDVRCALRVVRDDDLDVTADGQRLILL